MHLRIHFSSMKNNKLDKEAEISSLNNSKKLKNLGRCSDIYPSPSNQREAGAYKDDYLVSFSFYLSQILSIEKAVLLLIYQFVFCKRQLFYGSFILFPS